MTREHEESVEIREKRFQYAFGKAQHRSVTNYCATVPTAGHVLSAHMHNLPSIAIIT